VDLLILVVAMQLAFRQRKPSWSGASKWLVMLAVLLPCIAFSSSVALQPPTMTARFEDPCYDRLPLEDVLSPVTRAVCICGCAVCLLLSAMANNDTSKSEVSTEAVYLLVGLAGLTWLMQLALELSHPAPHLYSTKFFIFASAMMYNFFSVVYCLVLVLRGDGLNGWKKLLRLRKLGQQASDSQELQSESDAYCGLP
jgi:hypothetical protein